MRERKETGFRPLFIFVRFVIQKESVLTAHSPPTPISKPVVLLAQVLAHVRLVEDGDAAGF